MKFSQKLLEIKATDGVLLPGLLYEPVKKTKKILVLLHGNGSSSVFKEVKANNEMAKALANRGVSYLIFNNRGAHYLNRLHIQGSKKRVMGGMAYELIKDCIKDIDGAIALLKRKGYKEFYLVGFSTGANKICVYDYYKKHNPISKYVLVGGGDDSGIYYNQFGKKKFFGLLGEAKSKIVNKKGKELVDYNKIEMIFSHQSLFDIMNPDGPYNIFPFYYHFEKMVMGKKKFFKEFRQIKKPCLIIYGEKDEYGYGKIKQIVETLKEQNLYPENKKYLSLKGGDHSLHGKEQELAKTVAGWLSTS